MTDTPRTGQDEKIQASKIEPLESDAKTGVPKDDIGGVTGTDAKIDRARIDPVGGYGVGQNPAPAEDTQGVVGKDTTIQDAKIEPLKGPLAAESGSGGKDGEYKGDMRGESSTKADGTGLDGEDVDKSRIEPLGEVREDIKP